MNAILDKKDINLELKNLFEDIENIKSNVDIFDNLLKQQLDKELALTE